MTTVIVRCSQLKQTDPAPAAELYTGGYTMTAIRWVRTLPNPDLWILSAKYGLIPGDTIIEPYNVTFSRAKKSRHLPPPIDTFQLRHQVIDAGFTGTLMVLAGKDYLRALSLAAGDLIHPVNPFADEADRRWSDRREGRQRNLMNDTPGHIPPYAQGAA